MKKTFTLGQVLNVTTGILMTSIDDVYNILDHMTSDNLFTHQLSRAADECEPWLFRWFPELKNIEVNVLEKAIENKNKEDVRKIIDEWLQGLINSGISSTFEIEQIPKGEHEIKDPILELLEMHSEFRQ